MRSEMNTACDIILDNLIALAEGSSPEDVRIHLESCPDCVLVAERFSRAWGNVGPAMAMEPSASLLLGVLQRIESDARLSSRLTRTFAAFWRRLRPVAAAATLLAGILAGYEMGKPASRGPAPKDSVSLLLLENVESIPKGSVADFYVGKKISEKEEHR